MLNQIVVVGRLVRDPEIKELNNDRKVATITLAVPRSYKNMNGVYDTDFIPCTLWDDIANHTSECCKKGDLVGVKGRMQKENENDELRIIAEKVTFLSSSKK